MATDSKPIESDLKISPEAKCLATELFFETSQTQKCLDLLAVSDDVYDIESTRKVLEFAAEHGIRPERLAGFVSQLLERRGDLPQELPAKSAGWFDKWCKVISEL
jgi:hypothetical protein